jgi:hypothetical protein
LPKHYGDYVAAQQQYSLIREAFPSFNSTLSFRDAVDKLERRSSDITGNYNLFTKMGQTDNDFKFVATNDPRSDKPPLWQAIEGALSESAEAYRPERGKTPPDYVNTYNTLINAKNSGDEQRYKEARNRYLNFMLASDTQKTRDLSATIMEQLPTSLKQDLVYVKVVHVKGLGFVPFAKIKKGGSFEMRRLTSGGVSLFSSEDDAVKAFENQAEGAVSFKAEGGSVSIADRLRSMQKVER